MDLQKALKIFTIQSLAEVSLDDLRRIYHDLAKSTHPDKGGSHEDFIRLQEAYKKLVDEYDINNDPSRKKLRVLSKEEILDKYYTEKKGWEIELESLESEINHKNQIVSETFFQSQNLTKQYQNQSKTIQEEFEKEINQLEKAYFPSVWRKIFQFWKTKSSLDLKAEFEDTAKHYQNLLDKTYRDYILELNKLYSQGLDNLSNQESVEDSFDN